jgi:uncharacterized membrane protein YfcA
MTPASLVALLALAAVAAYVQTLTGFALGLVLMGGVGLTGLLPLPDAAVLVSILTLCNAALVLAKGWRDVAWTEFRLISASSIVALFVGYALLEFLAGTSLAALRLVLGAVIIASSLQLLFRPQPLARRSPAPSFIGFGLVGGLMGGLFSTSGPPIVYHLYRQPLPHASVRETLLLIFAVNGVVRLAVVGAAGRMPPASSWWALLAIPAVLGFTYLARRWPPPLSRTTLRRAAFALLLCSGLSLGLPPLVGLFRAAAG